MALSTKYFNTSEFFSLAERLGMLTSDSFPLKTCKRLETRTRKRNPDVALSFGVYDPLWMLTRQWQFGEFKGDDGGSAIWSKIKISHQNITAIFNEEHKTDLNREDALEYFVERMNSKITKAVRIESAHYFVRILKYSGLKSYSKEIVGFLKTDYPLIENDFSYSSPAREQLKEIEREKNKNRENFLAAFGKATFDGYEVFIDLKSEGEINPFVKQNFPSKAITEFKALSKMYVEWFMDNFFSVEEKENFWSDEALAYNLSLSVSDKNIGSKTYKLSNYNSGRLSWYSFDQAETETSDEESPKNLEEKFFTYIPVLAEFQGAPNKRLWAFEDAKVNLGTVDLESSDLATALVLQYTTMYGNDWLITPIELKPGRVSKVEGIIVTDVFGVRYFIDRPAGETSTANRFTQRWEMFTIAKENAYIKKDFRTDGALFYPPSLVRTEEGDPIEEVQFLRDEMSNMIWAVESKINDGCGSTLEGNSFGAEIESEVKTRTEKHTIDEVDADYSFLFQNSVPFNWIPFSPVRLETEGVSRNREIQMQRSTMPAFFENEFVPIRPQTQLLRKGINEKDQVKSHLFVNEEEILGIGTKLSLNHQRTRWFNGKTYNWIGTKKEINKTQAYSGLAFDELKEIIKTGEKLKSNK